MSDINMSLLYKLSMYQQVVFIHLKTELANNFFFQCSKENENVLFLYFNNCFSEV